MPRKTPRACQMIARDIERLGGIAARLGEGGSKEIGASFGPPGSRLFVQYKCAREEKFGPGPCSVFSLTRTGSAVKKLGLRERTSVGNLYGLVRQLSRDITKSWGCMPGKETGFEGARRRRI